MASPFLDAIGLVQDTAVRHGFRIALIGGFALPFHGVRRATVGVPVVDVEGLIGLKLQAIVNDPARRRQDEADIVTLLTLHLSTVDRVLLDEYFALFDEQDALVRFLDEARQRRG